MKIRIQKISWLLLLCISIACAEQQTTQDHSITVFIHGTYFLRKLLHHLPWRQLVYCPEGLTLAKHLPPHYYFHRVALSCVACDRQHYSLDQFYIFGWPSEYISDTTRQKAAKVLAEQLHEVIIDYYMRHNQIPKVRLIGYSHGGNVILRLADYLPFYTDLHEVELEAWLFGTPVQVITHDLVNCQYFRNVYSIYSKRDKVQTLDPQGLLNRKLTKNRFWSERTFDPQTRCIQVEFTVNGQSITHGYYHYIFKYFPKIKEAIETKAAGLQNGGMIAVDFKCASL